MKQCSVWLKRAGRTGQSIEILPMHLANMSSVVWDTYALNAGCSGDLLQICFRVWTKTWCWFTRNVRICRIILLSCWNKSWNLLLIVGLINDWLCRRLFIVWFLSRLLWLMLHQTLYAIWAEYGNNCSYVCGWTIIMWLSIFVEEPVEQIVIPIYGFEELRKSSANGISVCQFHCCSEELEFTEGCRHSSVW